MEKEKHIKIHEHLHRSLDELVGDYITHTHNLPSNTNLMDFMKWSYQQTVEPDDIEEDDEDEDIGTKYMRIYKNNEEHMEQAHGILKGIPKVFKKGFPKIVIIPLDQEEQDV